MDSHRYRDGLEVVLPEDLWFNTIQCFMETGGPEVATQVLTPMFELFGKLGMEGQIRGSRALKLDELVSYACFIWKPMSGGETRGEMYEKGAKSYTTNCRFEGRSPEICHLRCDVMIPAWGTLYKEHSLNIARGKSLPKGDPECEFFWLKEPSSSFDLGEQLLFHQIMPDELEAKAVRNWVSEMWVETWRHITEAFVKTVGEQIALPALEKQMRSLGLTKGKEYASVLGIEGSDLKSLGRLIDSMNTILQMEGIDASEGEGKVEKSIMACPYSGSPAMCAQMEAFCNGIVEGISPEYEFCYDRMKTKGDETCHWTIKKKINDKEARQREPIDDPFKVLKMRFVKGEISEEEYKRMKAVIE